MKKDIVKSLLVLAGAVLFNIVFWHQKLALNALLFDAFVLWSVFYLYPVMFSSKTTRWLLLAHIVSLATVVIHNTELSKLAFSITLLLVVAFTQYLHRSVWFAAGSALMNYVFMLPSFFGSIKTMKFTSRKTYSLYKGLRFLIIPLIIGVIFFFIYSNANVMFQGVVNDIGMALQNFFSRIFDWFNWERFGFLLLGLLITGGLLLKSNVNFFSDEDVSKHNDMFRKKHDYKKWKESAAFDLLSLFMGRFANGNMALKNESIVGLICLVLLNVLLFTINCIDIVYVWFGSSYHTNINYSEYVHEGTGLLIFSIILAMSVLFFFFRGNLNFYKKNKWLKYGAYCWIIQNIILVISVLMRDYYYIANDGLAYKRIGVLFFLLMVLSGLVTTFIKIRSAKTKYYLLKVNAWVGIVLLVASSCLHWDECIARYNIARKNSIPLDITFILSLSDKALPVIEQNKDILDKYPDLRDNARFTSKQLFEMRKKDFFEEQKQYSWLSWNESDQYIKKHLPGPVIASTVKN